MKIFLILMTIVMNTRASPKCLIENSFYNSNIFTSKGNSKILFSQENILFNQTASSFWKFLPVNNSTSMFFIQNGNMYLYATNQVSSFLWLKAKRRVILKKFEANDNDAFQWSFHDTNRPSPSKILKYLDLFYQICAKYI